MNLKQRALRNKLNRTILGNAIKSPTSGNLSGTSVTAFKEEDLYAATGKGVADDQRIYLQ